MYRGMFLERLGGPCMEYYGTKIIRRTMTRHIARARLAVDRQAVCFGVLSLSGTVWRLAVLR